MSTEQRVSVVISPDSIGNLQEVKERVRTVPVCLITTPSPFLADERVFPFLAPPKLAAELRKNGNPVNLLDLSGYSNFTEIVTDFMHSNPTRTFGITATSPQIPAAVAIRDTIKNIDPTAVVIIGGPHVTLTHGAKEQNVKGGIDGRGETDFKQITDIFDKVVVGDGERAIFHAIDPQNRDQIIDASNRNSSLFMAKGELEDFEPPARDLIDLDSYHYYIDDHRAFSLIAQLGCPFECGFCGGRDVQAYRMARTRSIESVTNEIANVVSSSITRAIETSDPEKVLTAVMFYDDELNVSPANLENLCRGLIDLQKKFAQEIPSDVQEALGLKIEEVDGEKRLSMRFRGFVKAELFTSEQARLMYEAGFRVLLTGVESGSDTILATMKKHTSRAINSRCVDYAHQAGLKVKALMSIGHPGDSKETIEESIEWACSNLKEGDEIDWTIITQYPGSPYYDRSVYIAEKDAWLYSITDKTGTTRNLWSKNTNYTQDVYYYKGIPGNYTAYVWTDYLSPEELVQMRDSAEKTTRDHLGLPAVTHVETRSYEHSMGQTLPPSILRSSKTIYQS